MAQVLESEPAFSPGGFPSTKTAQERFTLRLLGHRYARPEVPSRNWLTFVAGGGLAALAALYLDSRGQSLGAMVAWRIMGLQALLALVSVVRKLGLKKTNATGHPHACYRDGDGALNIPLGEQEFVAARLQLDTTKKEWIRWVAGLAQTFWGMLLAGIPPVFIAGQDVGTFTVVLSGIFAFLGTLLFGKGVRDIFGLRFAEVLFITNHRMVIAAGPGEARSIPWTHLKQRPIVVGRTDKGATLGLALVPLISVGRLPAFGLWGKDNMDETNAKELAAFVVQSREKLLAAEQEPS
ncbi:MAG: hypothetical protein CMH56_05510 [Myxococcales bacterium]|nr:hypothetical protein [Myxococcales bacterium]